MYSQKALYFSLSFLLFQLLSGSDMKYYNTIIGFITIYSFINFLDKLGNKVTILEFISFSAILLWLTVPTIFVSTGLDKYITDGTKPLAVDEATYYDYAIPGTIALGIGLLLPLFQSKNKEKIVFDLVFQQLRLESNRNIVKTLLITGIIGTFFAPIAPPQLAFFAHLLSQVLYVSVFYAFFSPYSDKKMNNTVILFIIISQIISGGMFGVIVWWGLCVLMIVSIRYKFRFSIKLFVAIIGSVFILFLQVLKKEYRDLTWFAVQKSESNSSLFWSATYKTFSDSDAAFSKLAFSRTLTRLNQAYLSSLVLKHVPAKEPYAEGETIIRAILSSLVPRFLWENKVKSGGQENMRRFAGTKLVGSTSMDIAQLGDGYANFGKVGGIIFLFFYGLFNNYLYHKIVSISLNKYPTLILWSPFVFIQLLKVEVSIDTMFNAATKGAFFVFLCYWAFKKFFKIQL